MYVSNSCSLLFLFVMNVNLLVIVLLYIALEYSIYYICLLLICITVYSSNFRYWVCACSQNILILDIILITCCKSCL